MRKINCFTAIILILFLLTGCGESQVSNKTKESDSNSVDSVYAKTMATNQDVKSMSMSTTDTSKTNQNQSAFPEVETEISIINKPSPAVQIKPIDIGEEMIYTNGKTFSKYAGQWHKLTGKDEQNTQYAINLHLNDNTPYKQLEKLKPFLKDFKLSESKDKNEYILANDSVGSDFKKYFEEQIKKQRSRDGKDSGDISISNISFKFSIDKKTYRPISMIATFERDNLKYSYNTYDIQYDTLTEIKEPTLTQSSQKDTSAAAIQKDIDDTLKKTQQEIDEANKQIDEGVKQAKANGKTESLTVVSVSGSNVVFKNSQGKEITLKVPNASGLLNPGEKCTVTYSPETLKCANIETEGGFSFTFQ